MNSFKSNSQTVKQWLAAKQEPMITVGIMRRNVVEMELHGHYICAENRNTYTGRITATINNGEILISDKHFHQLSLIPQEEKCCCSLANVTIGIGFHWQQEETQQFEGEVHLVVIDQAIQVINRLQVERYIHAVIGSEMSATSDLELLKAHAVISRSWLLAPMINGESNTAVQETITNEEIVRWYERNAHTYFDVCADDHCQRYQGLTRTTTATLTQAIAETKGEVLTMDNEICDARFSKSCGGVTELFENCWGKYRKHNYLRSIYDHNNHNTIDLSNEQQAQNWIKTQPEAFCNIRDKKILSQILNNYDQNTPDFFRWHITYTPTELNEIVRQKSGIDFGKILSLIPLQRGPSGRIIRLKIVGERCTKIVGKELEIRKWLSPSHLYSSAFYVEQDNEHITLHGAGWGHGVGLCQIGAAQMSQQGYNYHEILMHYFRGASIQKLW
ncbi:MAG: SpoIID/LytB domain-containing protein [Bacteroidales bacterium]|nr:SpoIID/LytB domain-containing protein [Bacteroidales bacterium]